MEETTTQKVAKRKKIVALAVAMIVLGFVVGIITFLTIIGPILGLILAAFGVVLLWRAAKADRPPV